jgi:hypothetical protein
MRSRPAAAIASSVDGDPLIEPMAHPPAHPGECRDPDCERGPMAWVNGFIDPGIETLHLGPGVRRDERIEGVQ